MFISSRSSSRFITFLFPTNQQARRSSPAPFQAAVQPCKQPTPPQAPGLCFSTEPSAGKRREVPGAQPVPRGQRPRSAAPPAPPRPRQTVPVPVPPRPPAPSGSCVAYREGSAIYIYSSGLFLSDWHFEEQPGRVGGAWGGYMDAHRGTFASPPSLRERGRGEGIRSGERRKKTRRSGRR